MQIEPDTAPLILEELIFEPAALLHLPKQFGIGGAQGGRALLDALLQLGAREAELMVAVAQLPFNHTQLLDSVLEAASVGRELLFGVFALGDILGDGGDAIDAALAIANSERTKMDPTKLHIRHNDSEFLVEIGLGHSGPTVLHAQTILVVNGPEPGAGIGEQTFAGRTPGFPVSGADVRKDAGKFARWAFKHEKNRADIFGQLPESLFIFPESIISGAMSASDPDLLQGTLNGRRQPHEAVLHDVVMRAGFESGDGDFFADVTGHDNEGNVQSAKFEQFQCFESAESRHDIIGNDDIALFPLECGAEGIRGLESFRHRLITAPPQLTQQ